MARRHRTLCHSTGQSREERSAGSRGTGLRAETKHKQVPGGFRTRVPPSPQGLAAVPGASPVTPEQPPTQTGSGPCPAPHTRGEQAAFGLRSVWWCCFNPPPTHTHCVQAEGKAVSAAERGGPAVCPATSGRTLQIPGPGRVTGDQGEGKSSPSGSQCWLLSDAPSSVGGGMTPGGDTELVTTERTPFTRHACWWVTMRPSQRVRAQGSGQGREGDTRVLTAHRTHRLST